MIEKGVHPVAGGHLEEGPVYYRSQEAEMSQPSHRYHAPASHQFHWCSYAFWS